MTTGKYPPADLKAVLKENGISQAELSRLVREDSGLAASESQMSRYANGLRPGSLYRAAITRALATKGVTFIWGN